MIGSFWNLCRACPSMPVDKLHSEYRSTYKWHEFRSVPAGGVDTQPAPQPASMPFTRGPMEPAMPRRKKYPGVAYKANEFFDHAPVDIRPQQLRQSVHDRARTAERNDPERAGRRSKSEGPRQTRWTDTVEPKPTTAIGEAAPKDADPSSTEYRNQFAWPKEEPAPRKSISMGALKKAAIADGSTEAEPLIRCGEREGAGARKREDYCDGPKPQRKSTFRTALTAFISSEDRTKDKKRYKSEYKKKFRPFSQYVFEASKGRFTKCRQKDVVDGQVGATGAAGAAGAAGAEGGRDALAAAGLPSLRREGDAWYREVLDLRKRAGEYKYRGWGTELAPEHITQLYNKQIELWHQVSRRSSLSALSLATTNHKALPRDEKDGKDGKDSKNHSPKKFRSFRSAPHQSIHAKIQETRAQDRSPHKTSPQKQKKKMGHSFEEGHEDGKAEPKGEFKSPRRRPRSADPAPAQVKHVPNGHEPPPRPRKPTGLPLNKAPVSSNKVRASRVGRSPVAPVAPGSGAVPNGALPHRVPNGALPHRVPNGAAGKAPPERRSRSISKVGIKLDDEAPSLRSASVAKDHYFDDSPVVKSPPEPTRVKSPEQMNMKSPDPVNWTVPLDTGKTFTVTQNVKTDEHIKRPSSDFKMVSVGEDARPSEITPIHHQQMSPIRSVKKSESPTSSRRTDKTPTTPASLTPIDETRALDLKVNGVNGVNGNTSDLTPDTDVQLVKKSTEATQVAPGVVDTTLVTEGSGGLTASEVLDRARNRFDKFWGKREEDTV